MKINISSSELFASLQYASRALGVKTTMPILDHFLFEASEDKLKITASDRETTQIVSLEPNSIDEEGAIAVPSHLLLDSLKEFVDQPITIETNVDTLEVVISWETGAISVPGMSAEGYPDVTKQIEEETKKFSIDASVLFDGIALTVFASAEKSIRPIMNGVFMDITPNEIIFVATDGHKLVKVPVEKTFDIEERMSFTLPRKAATLLKGFLTKESGTVEVSFDSKNIHFKYDDSILITRAIEGTYPNYNAVIPQNNKSKVVVNRRNLLNTVKRVSVCSDQANKLVKMTLGEDKLGLAACDIDFATSADDRIEYSYEGDNIAIGLRANHIVEMLSVMSSEEVALELTDATRAMLILPVNSENECEKNMVMLLMPIML
ncbi:MAG: DNA polymerase III subunit beta [Bacteroidetes bacterium]|nr:DNA polymerase III subunit beta [Bacteroidota bacterium]